MRFPESVELRAPRELSLKAVEVVPWASGNCLQLRHRGAEFGAGVRPGAAGASSLTAREFLFQSGRAGQALRVEAGNGSRTVVRSYRGRLRVRLSQGQLRVINEVELRDYLVCVVGSESLPHFQLEALKAQAVLATNVLLQELAQAASSGAGGSLLKDNTETQAYLGAAYERPLARSAVQAVFPQVLLAPAANKLLPVYYHSTCAGGTSLPEDVFVGGDTGPIPAARTGVTSLSQSRSPVGNGKKAELEKSLYRRVPCHFCKVSPFFKELPEVFDSAAMRAKLGFLPLAVVLRDQVGRPERVLVEEAPGRQRQISGYQLWLEIGQNFGWGKVPGTRYSFTREKDKLKFTSSGCGHGVGFCQWGAQGMALAGQNYRQILDYYFPGARLRIE